MKTILVIIIFTLLESCAIVPTNVGNGYIVEQAANKKITFGEVKIEYEDYDFFYQRKLDQLKNKMASKEEIENLQSEIPDGGYIIIKIKRISIGSANTEWFEFIIKDGEKEIYRKKGDKKIPRTPISDNLWWNIALIPLKKKIDKRITLYVVDNLVGGRDKFTILKIFKSN